MLRDMSIPGSGSWEKLLREHTFKNFSKDMKFITVPCKTKTSVTDIYTQLKKFNFGIILEEERLNKSGGILKTDQAYRIAKLMEMVASDAFGQIFVTDARPERTLGIFENINHQVKIFEVDSGKLHEVTT